MDKDKCFEFVKDLGNGYSIVEFYYGKFGIINTHFLPLLDGRIFLDEKDAEEYYNEKVNFNPYKPEMKNGILQVPNHQCNPTECMRNIGVMVSLYTKDGEEFEIETEEEECIICHRIHVDDEEIQRRNEFINRYVTDDEFNGPNAYSKLIYLSETAYNSFTEYRYKLLNGLILRCQYPKDCREPITIDAIEVDSDNASILKFVNNIFSFFCLPCKRTEKNGLLCNTDAEFRKIVVLLSYIPKERYEVISFITSR